MPKNLNSFILADSTIDKMMDNLKKTKEIRKEMGFNLCQIEGTNVLKDDDLCLGSDCQIRLARTCRIGKKVGGFHTHPGDGTGMSKMSLTDMEHAYVYGINCIGGVEDQKINCFVRKDKVNNRKDYDIIKYHRKRFEPLQDTHAKTTRGFELVKSRFRERNYIIAKLTDHYFNTIDVV